jgi:hypothetical protein
MCGERTAHLFVRCALNNMVIWKLSRANGLELNGGISEDAHSESSVLASRYNLVV